MDDLLFRLGLIRPGADNAGHLFLSIYNNILRFQAQRIIVAHGRKAQKTARKQFGDHKAQFIHMGFQHNAAGSACCKRYSCRVCHFHMYRNRAQNTREAAGESSAQIPKQTACRSIPSENPESSGTTSCPTVWMSFRPETGSRLFAFSSAATSHWLTLTPVCQ